MAQSGHHNCAEPCPLLGVKRTLVRRSQMSAFDPKRTLLNHKYLPRIKVGRRASASLGYEMEIRDAVLEDAAAVCDVLRRSITELCVSDHHGDAAALEAWLSNKNPNAFRSWLAHHGNSVLVAVEQTVVLGVGAVTDAGEIILNYVSPDARFRGVSRTLLRALEARAAKQGNVRCTLTST